MTSYDLRQNGVPVLDLPLSDLTPGDIWEIHYKAGDKRSEFPATMNQACYFVDDGGALCGPWPTVEVAQTRAEACFRQPLHSRTPSRDALDKLRTSLQCALDEWNSGESNAIEFASRIFDALQGDKPDAPKGKKDELTYAREEIRRLQGYEVRLRSAEVRMYRAESELKRISEEMALPPGIGPAEGELRRLLDEGRKAIKERDELRAALFALEHMS